MQRYIIRRIFQALITLFFVSMLIFVLVRLTGDPLDVLLPMEASEEDYAVARKSLGLDKPLPVQYGIYISKIIRGDFGVSIRAKVPVSQLLLDRMPYTLKLAALSITISLILAAILGVTSAVRKGSIIDTISRFIAVSGMSIPAFWLGIMSILVFSVNLRLLPSSRAGGFDHYILPAYQPAPLSRQF